MATHPDVSFRTAQRDAYVQLILESEQSPLISTLVNIHTHLIPFLVWSFNIIPVSPFASAMEAHASGLPELIFTVFALMCLFSSALWHTMAGCAHLTGMDLCARLDYVGIGWLISASVGTIVHYGFEGHDQARNVFLMSCVVMGVLGSVFPFMRWFNDRRYRVRPHLGDTLIRDIDRGVVPCSCIAWLSF